MTENPTDKTDPIRPKREQTIWRVYPDDNMEWVVTQIAKRENSTPSDVLKRLFPMACAQMAGIRLWNDDASDVKNAVADHTKSIQEMTAAFADLRAGMVELLAEFRGGLANYLEVKSGIDELTVELKAAREFSNTDPNLLRRLDRRMDNFEQRMGSVMYARGFAERALVYAIRANCWGTLSARHQFPRETFNAIADEVAADTREIFAKDTATALSKTAALPPPTSEG